ncbi:MAG: hypothetical protein WC861_00905 [Candidatus Micrarchaeia archaeon]
MVDATMVQQLKLLGAVVVLFLLMVGTNNYIPNGMLKLALNGAYVIALIGFFLPWSLQIFLKNTYWQSLTISLFALGCKWGLDILPSIAENGMILTTTYVAAMLLIIPQSVKNLQEIFTNEKKK